MRRSAETDRLALGRHCRRWRPRWHRTGAGENQRQQAESEPDDERIAHAKPFRPVKNSPPTTSSRHNVQKSCDPPPREKRSYISHLSAQRRRLHSTATACGSQDHLARLDTQIGGGLEQVRRLNGSLRAGIGDERAIQLGLRGAMLRGWPATHSGKTVPWHASAPSLDGAPLEPSFALPAGRAGPRGPGTTNSKLPHVWR